MPVKSPLPKANMNYLLFILIRNKYVFWGTEIKTSERIPHTLVATFYIHTIII